MDTTALLAPNGSPVTYLTTAKSTECTCLPQRPDRAHAIGSRCELRDAGSLIRIVPGAIDGLQLVTLRALQNWHSRISLTRCLRN